MDAKAVIFEKPGELALDAVSITDPKVGDVVVESRFSGISTGTERLLWEGRMPDFPGMGYPLVPGYETVGQVIDDRSGKFKQGQLVFVPGSVAYRDVKGLFGGTASNLVASSSRAIPLDHCEPQDGVLLALAATAHHALALPGASLPQLIIGNGVLGQLIARLVVSLGGQPPRIWETDPTRQCLNCGFEVIDPSANGEVVYDSIVDVSGDANIINSIAPVLSHGGEITLAGFYSGEISFAFPPVFMKEARFRVAAEWKPEDLDAVQRLLKAGRFNLANLITHQRPVNDAHDAYATAFSDPACLKMVLDWKGSA
ncbi:MAG: chlorophyll synthesis pathway protein BchC [Rhizobiaceae bacterium]|nr:chlorophyll synthesis pathway protein BchC [Rhizobiaceae bacterium]